MAYVKISDMTAGSAVGAADLFEAVQSSASVKVTGAQLKTYAGGGAAAVTAATIVRTYMFDPDSAIDISSSFSDGMATTVTVIGVPSDTRAMLLQLQFDDTGLNVVCRFRASAASTIQDFRGSFEDGGTNILRANMWISTFDNTFRVDSLNADTTSNVYVLGYMAET